MSDELILDTSWSIIGDDFAVGHKGAAPTFANISRNVTLDPPVAGQFITGRILKSTFIGMKDGDWIRGEPSNVLSGDLVIATDWNGRIYFGCAYPYDIARVIVYGDAGHVVLGREFTFIKIVMRRTEKGRAWQLAQSKEEYHATHDAACQKASATRAAKRAAKGTP